MSASCGARRGQRVEQEPDEALTWARGWQRHDDPCFLLDDGRGQFDQVEAQRVELSATPWRAFWTGRA